MSEHEMDAIVDRAHSQVDLLESALSGLQDIKATASSEDGHVHAEVDGNGTLTDLTMSDAISNLDPRTLAQLITITAQQAARSATEQRVQVLTTLQDSFGAV